MAKTLDERRKYVREYVKEWRRKNPERSQEITIRYWENKLRRLKELEAQQV